MVKLSIAGAIFLVFVAVAFIGLFLDKIDDEDK